MTNVLNTSTVHCNPAKQCWGNIRIMMYRWLRIWVKISIILSRKIGYSWCYNLSPWVKTKELDRVLSTR